MASNPHPAAVSNSVQVELCFAKPGEPAEQGFLLRFALAPDVGDIIEVDERSIQILKDPELRVREWKVVDVRHKVSIDLAQLDDLHAAGLQVTVNPL